MAWKIKKKTIMMLLSVLGFSGVSRSQDEHPQPEYGVIIVKYGPPSIEYVQYSIGVKVLSAGDSTALENILVKFSLGTEIYDEKKTDSTGSVVSIINTDKVDGRQLTISASNGDENSKIIYHPKDTAISFKELKNKNEIKLYLQERE